MIVDSRYHAASLAAIFLALGLGIIIGSTLVGENFSRKVAASQEELISRLEEDYGRLRDEARKNKEEMAVLQETLKYYQVFAKEALPEALVRAGVTVHWPADDAVLETMQGQLEVIKAIIDG